MRRVLEILAEAEEKKAKKEKIKYKYTDLIVAIRKALKGAKRGFGKTFEWLDEEDGMKKKTAAQKKQWQEFQRKGAAARRGRGGSSAAGGKPGMERKGMTKKQAKAVVRKGLGGAASYPPVFGR